MTSANPIRLLTVGCLMIGFCALVAGCSQAEERLAANIAEFNALRNRVMNATQDEATQELKAILSSHASSDYDRIVAMRLLLELDVKHNGLPMDAALAFRRLLGSELGSTVFMIRDNRRYPGEFPLDGIDGLQGPQYTFRFRTNLCKEDSAMGDALWFSVRLEDVSLAGNLREMLDREQPSMPVAIRAIYFAAPDGGYSVTANETTTPVVEYVTWKKPPG